MKNIKFRLVFKHPSTNFINIIHLTLDEVLDDKNLENIREFDLQCNCPIDDYESQEKYCECNYETELISKDLCIGIQDVSKKDIYENDILSHKTDITFSENFTIIYNEECASFICKYETEEDLYWFSQDIDVKYCKVIGNIYETPDLRKIKNIKDNDIITKIYESPESINIKNKKYEHGKSAIEIVKKIDEEMKDGKWVSILQ